VKLVEKAEVIRLRTLGEFNEIAKLSDEYNPDKETDTDIILNIAEVYCNLKQYEKSIKWYKRAAELGVNEDIFTPLSELYRITHKGDNDWDELYMKAAKAKISDDLKNMILYEKNRIEGASEEELIKILTSFAVEELSDLHLTELAELYIRQDDFKEAKKYLKKILRFSAQDVYLDHARALLEMINEGNETVSHGFKEIRSKIYGCRQHVQQADQADIEELKSDKIGQKEDILADNDTGERNCANDNALAALYRKNSRKNKRKTKIIQSIEELFADVVGMQNIKEGLQSFYNVLQLQNDMKSDGIDKEILVKNFLITGERGSGKSLVAGIIASMLDMFGLIGTDSVIEVNSREVREAYLKGGLNGLMELFSELNDMVVVIDHIERTFEDSEEKVDIAFVDAIAELIKKRMDSLSFIITGTKAAMDRFANEDIKNLVYSRLDIPYYSIDELVELTCLLARDRNLTIEPTVYKALRKRIQIERCTGEFANAISLQYILKEVIKHIAERRYTNTTVEGKNRLIKVEAEDFEIEDIGDESVEELLSKLDGLTGLKQVKKEVRSKIDSVIIQQEATELGANRNEGFGTLHMVFKGSPGTGKTTVARIIGKIYQKLGVLPRGNVFVECTRKDLVGEYQGHTAKKTHEKVKEALGGILFIDEAYSLVQGQEDVFGLEALNTLVADIENYRDSLMVILAGYSEEIDKLLSQNPGLASRFPNEIVFEDYTLDEMVSIFKYMIKEKGMLLDRDTADAVYSLIKEKSKKKDFGNARGVRNLVEKVISAMERRLVELRTQGMVLGKNDYDIIKKVDIEAVIGKDTAIEKSIEDLLNELDNMIGMRSVKEKVREMIALIKRKELSEKLNLKTNNSFGSLHMVFTGNAGTGKTTVARLIGKIYGKLGLLKNGDIFVECSRAGLIGQYMGQTTKKVEDKVKEAEGGILFIDEAYDLCQGDNDNYGKEIVSTLLKAIEDKRDNLMVIMAGYKDKIDEFFSTNQGLRSRMATELYFEDYTLDELTQIFYYMATADHMTVEDGLEECIKGIILEELKKQPDFGNARGVRNLYEKVIRKQALRLFDMKADNITQEELTTIKKEDFF